MKIRLYTFLFIMLVAVIPAVGSNPFIGVFPDHIKCIAVIAPGLPAANSQLADKAVKYLAEAGKKVKVMPNARRGEPCRSKYGSVDWRLRKADLEQAWLDEEVDLILCLRGGYDTYSMVKNLDWAKLRTRPDMPVQGFSDITALHLAMLKEKAGHPVCAPSLIKIMQVDAASRESINLAYCGKPRADIKLDVLRKGSAQGLIIAGHLRVVDEINQTRFKADTQGKVIFFECPDLNEQKAAATLERLRRSGFFDHCAAVVFGRLSGCRKGERQVMLQFANQVKCPVFAGFPYSHTVKNHLLDFRREVYISENGILKFL